MREPEVVPKTSLAPCRQVVDRDDARSDGIVDVVVEVGEAVGDLDDLAFQRAGDAPALGGDALAQLRVLAGCRRAPPG